jgi:hypothetical protein
MPQAVENAKRAYQIAEDFIVRLCLWREARGASREAKRAIWHVLNNRANNPRPPYQHCHDLLSTILCRGQFSSFHAPDPNASLLPNPANPADWNSWVECCEVADHPGDDPTFGATHYHSVDSQSSPQWPAWASEDKQTVQIGCFRFYRI